MTRTVYVKFNYNALLWNSFTKSFFAYGLFTFTWKKVYLRGNFWVYLLVFIYQRFIHVNSSFYPKQNFRFWEKETPDQNLHWKGHFCHWLKKKDSSIPPWDTSVFKRTLLSGKNLIMLKVNADSGKGQFCLRESTKAQ